MIVRKNKQNGILFVLVLLIVIFIPMYWFLNSPELGLLSVTALSFASYLLMGCCIVVPSLLALGIVGKNKRKDE